LPHKADG
jgi:hypothetical protein